MLFRSIITKLTDKKVEFNYDKEVLKYENLIISNYNIKAHEDINKILLNPYEARLYKLK